MPKVRSGDRVPWPIPWASIVDLVPLADAKLPTAPEVAPQSGEPFAGFLQVAAPKRAGTYKITLSAAGWIDVVQSGHAVKSAAFSGATGCDGIRKSVKFDLTSAPFTLELSSVDANEMKIVISGD